MGKDLPAMAAMGKVGPPGGRGCANIFQPPPSTERHSVKALVYTAPKRLAWQEWPDPEPAQGEALVRVESIGVCGSDVHGWLGKSRGRVPPLILGHRWPGLWKT